MKKLYKLDLQKTINTTLHTIAEMGRNENVDMEIFGKFCRCFKCDIFEISEYRMEEK